MALGTAADEVKKVTALTTRTQALRDRWDLDFGLFTLDSELYGIPKIEGEWFKAVVNSASTDGNRMIDLLSFASEKLKIAITDEKMKERKDLVATEHAALGLLHLADTINEDDPEASTIRGQGAFYAVVRGWTAYRELITENDDGIFPDLKVWDPRNVYWVYGLNRLIWVSNVRYASPQEVRDEYPKWNGKADDKIGEDLVEIFDIWGVEGDKPAQEGVAINNEWVKDPQDVKVGGKPLFYIPVRIKSGRSAPLIRGGSKNTTASSTTSMENIKHVGESFLANVRDMLVMESRLFSYRMTQAGDLAKSANVVEFDGNKSQSKPPEGFEKGVAKGRTIYLDTSKGEKLAERMVPPDGRAIDMALGEVTAMRVTGTGIGPTAYGLPPFPSTAQGTDIINHNILDSIKPFRLLLQQDRVWQAEEFIRQYKMGGFKSQDFEGYDFRGKRFKAKNIKAKDIDDNWKFECELTLDLVRDENLNIGMAATMINSGLSSKQTARDEKNIVKDPDGEQAIIDREVASQIPELAYLKTAKELWDDKDDFSKLQAVLLFQKAMETLSPQQPQDTTGQAGVMRPEATAGAARNTSKQAQPVVPGPVRQAARERGKLT